MPTPSGERTAGFATFDVFRTDGPAVTAGLAEDVARELRCRTRYLPGFAMARVHTGIAGEAVVGYVAWTEPWPRESGLQELADLPGVHATTALGGTPRPGLTGTAAGRPPGMAAIAIRYLAGSHSAEAVLELLAASGKWKQDFPGFIAAIPHVSPDSRIFVNYPMWTDEAAYRAWMDDPRIPEGQQEVARLEVRPPEYLVCRVTAEIPSS